MHYKLQKEKQPSVTKYKVTLPLQLVSCSFWDLAKNRDSRLGLFTDGRLSHVSTYVNYVCVYVSMMPENTMSDSPIADRFTNIMQGFDSVITTIPVHPVAAAPLTQLEHKLVNLKK